MEKPEEESTAKFISALIKSVQTLCHGYLEFNNGIEIIGHINLSVDKGSSMHYILEEKVCKSEENSTLFISNSFHAQNQKDSKTKGKDSDAPSRNRTEEATSASDLGEDGKLSAISSISSALSKSHEKNRSGSTSSAKDSENSHSRPQSSTAKRKTSDEHSNDVRAAKLSHLSSSPSPVSHFLSQSPHAPSGSSSPVDTKPSMRHMHGEDSSGTVLPQTAAVTSDGAGDLGVNLVGSVLERVDDQHSNSDFQDRADDSDGDLEVTFIKEEYVEGEQATCQFDNSGGQQYGRGSHQRASSSDMSDGSMYPVPLHHSQSASSTFVPSAAQHYAPSTSSQPQPGTSGMRGVSGWARAVQGFHTMGVSRNMLTERSPGAMAIKTYTCHICKYSSTYLTNFKRHMRRHTGQLFRCEVCGVQYNCRYYLQKHILRNHGAQPQSAAEVDAFSVGVDGRGRRQSAGSCAESTMEEFVGMGPQESVPPGSNTSRELEAHSEAGQANF